MRNTPFFIAKRYLFSRKSVNAINIISGISMAGVLVGSAALIIILSVFNGLEEMILEMYGDFAPQLRIEATEGKSFSERTLDIDAIQNNENIAYVSKVLQEKVLLKYGENQFIGTLKGTNLHGGVNGVPDSLMQQGHFSIMQGGSDQVVIGAAVSAYLGVNIADDHRVLEIYSPKRDIQNALNPAEEFHISYVEPVGVMKLQPQVDEFVFTSLQSAEKILRIADRITAIELGLVPGVSENTFKKDLSKSLGDSFVVKDQGEQNPMLYKILNSEKWAIFLILIFILIIAILNIIGSLTMLVVDKKKDIAVLKSLGAAPSLIKNIFFIEGMFISLIGCILGMSIGLIFCLLQIRFGLIAMEGASLITEVYPVSMRLGDFALIFTTVLSISAIASFVSSRLSVKGEEKLS